jgi:hypothetical protein
MLTDIRGGLEMLFSDQRRHKLAIPAHDKDGKPVTIAYLIDYLCQYVMKDNRTELFILDKHMYVSTLPGHTARASIHACLHAIDTPTPPRKRQLTL